MKPQDGALYRAYVSIERWDNGDDTDPVDISNSLYVMPLTDWKMRDDFVHKMKAVLGMASVDPNDDVTCIEEVIDCVDQGDDADDDADDDE